MPGRYLTLGLESDIELSPPHLALGMYPAILRVTLEGGTPSKIQAKHLSVTFSVSRWKKQHRARGQGRKRKCVLLVHWTVKSQFA